MPRVHRSVLFLVPALFLTLCKGAGQPIPGQNINMVSGRQWPGGDPFLQRQNEPSIAVSTRNPLHLLAGANDYRTVDLPVTDLLPSKELVGDAWLGVFKSFDGGQRWQSILLPGYPQDNSPAGLASPIKGLTTGADATVRAGTNGMFYYSGIAFNRGSNEGKLFVARFIDLANKENGDVTIGQDPIRYIGTVQIDKGTAGQFLDKPWLAVDIPRAGAGTCNIQVQQPTPLAGQSAVQSAATQTVNQSFAAGNVYVAYTVFVGNDNNIRTKLYFTRSTDCGATWSNPTKLSEGFPVNQGSVVQVDPRTGHVYVAWRQFASNNTLNSILIARSTDGGQSFTKAMPIVTLPTFNATNPGAPSFFDQGTTGGSFRVNAFPAMAIADSGVDGVPGRVFVAWAQRGTQPHPISARIMLTSSLDGVNWSAPIAMDNGPIVDDFPSLPGHVFTRGHQFMPSMTFNEGKLMLLYYDQRLDHTLGFFTANEPFLPDSAGEFYRESRNRAGGVAGNDPDSEIFTPFLTDHASASTPINPILLNRRHTVEVRVAQASQASVGNPPANPGFTFAQVSQYKFGTRGDEAGEIEFLQQLQVNPLGLPLFQSGCCPFAGDYIDIAGLSFVPPGALAASANSWKFNTAPRQNSVHFATYTSNQDVRPPADGNWANYTPAGTGMNRTSVFDGTAVPNCVAGQEGMRNQNIYSSRITGGLLLSSPQNTKPLSTTLQRTFVVLGQNFTDLNKSFRLTIVNQPLGGKASFLQFPSPPQPDPLTVLDVSIAANSGIARSVFATSTDPHAIIRVSAAEITGPGGAIVPGGLSNFVVLNADSTSPSLINADGAGAVGDIALVEIFTPNISNPNISNPNVSNPNVSNPNISNPNVSNPNVSNPNVSNPNISNPDIADPNVSNPNVSNPNISNPNVSNPNISNPNVSNAPVADATYTTTNNGNTGAAYNVKLVGTSPTPLQLILNKVHTTPAATNCELFDETHTILQSNVTSQNSIITPNISNDPVANITNPVIGNPSFFLAPGESALITIRGNVDTATMESIVTGVAPVVAAQAANSNDPDGTPETTAPLFIATATLPDASNNEAYTATLQVIGGQPPYFWALAEGSDSLPAGLTLNAQTGVISGTATQAGTFNLIFEVRDSSTPPRIARRAITITVDGVVDIEALSVAPREDTPTPWTVGQNVFIQFDIRNIGTATSSPSTPVVCTLGETTVVSTFLFGVGPGTTANLEFNFKVPGGQGTSPLLRCTVSDPADVNAENNSASTEVSIVGAITFTVTNTNDSGAGSLRQAILNANANLGFTDTINFAIPGEPPHLITPTSGLPMITDTLVLDATPSGTCSIGVPPLVEINGGSAGLAHGLLVNSVGSVIRGLAITGFTGATEFAGIFIAGGFSNVVECSYFGLAPDGATVKGNFDGVRIGGSFNNVIGGNSEAVRNVISGNLRNGVLIMGPVEGTQGSIMQNVVQGNYIGTDVTGTEDLGNLANGIQIINSARNTIGGTGLARNVISGNTGEGVRIDGATATENLVQGNYIGLDAFGTADLGNSASGVYIRRAPGNTVDRNTVSGNDGFAGVAICGDPEFCGGGNAGTQGNNASGNVIKGNLIGTTAAGTGRLGNSARGVSIDGAPNNVVGGPLASDGNVIAASGLNGVMIFNGADENLIRGNSIGTDASGTLDDLFNIGAGVLIQSGSNNIVSGKDDDHTGGNVIRFNTGAGIAVISGTGNRLRINRFKSNNGLGIDLGNDGSTPNDPGDADEGPNGLQNKPVLSTAAVNNGTVNIQGDLNSTPQTTFTIDFYVSNTCHQSETGEGGQWFGATTVTTNSDGNATFNVNFGGGVVSSGQIVSAIATSGDFAGPEPFGEGNTSEFSVCVQAAAP